MAIQVSSQVAEEIERSLRGFCQPIVLHLDPVCAYHLACGVQLALTHPKMPESGRETLAMVDKGLEERIAEECPELAALLASGSYANALSRLRTLGLIIGSKEIKAAQEFFV